MLEVTGTEEYIQHPGRCFICSIEEADLYMQEHCKNACLIDENTNNGVLANKVWWESWEHNCNMPTRKIAHYSKSKNLLIVYELNNDLA